MDIEHERKILRTLDYIVGLNDVDRTNYLRNLRNRDEDLARKIMDTLRDGKATGRRSSNAGEPE